MTTPAPIDLDALVVALVLDPATYSRNRFFDLYARSDVRRARRRAMRIRSIVRHMARANWAAVYGLLTRPAAHEGRTVLSYEVPAVMLRRTTVLDNLDLALVRVALGQIDGACASAARSGLLATADDKARIDATLARLAPAAMLHCTTTTTTREPPATQDGADGPSARPTLPT